MFKINYRRTLNIFIKDICYHKDTNIDILIDLIEYSEYHKYIALNPNINEYLTIEISKNNNKMDITLLIENEKSNKKVIFDNMDISIINLASSTECLIIRDIIKSGSLNNEDIIKVYNECNNHDIRTEILELKDLDSKVIDVCLDESNEYNILPMIYNKNTSEETLDRIRNDYINDVLILSEMIKHKNINIYTLNKTINKICDDSYTIDNESDYIKSNFYSSLLLSVINNFNKFNEENLIKLWTKMNPHYIDTKIVESLVKFENTPSIIINELYQFINIDNKDLLIEFINHKNLKRNIIIDVIEENDFNLNGEFNHLIEDIETGFYVIDNKTKNIEFWSHENRKLNDNDDLYEYVDEKMVNNEIDLFITFNQKLTEEEYVEFEKLGMLNVFNALVFIDTLSLIDFEESKFSLEGLDFYSRVFNKYFVNKDFIEEKGFYYESDNNSEVKFLHLPNYFSKKQVEQTMESIIDTFPIDFYLSTNGGNKLPFSLEKEFLSKEFDGIPEFNYIQNYLLECKKRCIKLI